jgi:hypothetical protein
MVMRWSLSGLPVVAAARFDTWKSRVAGATVPFRTAVIRMTVCPTVPLAGDEVADRVTPSTLPVAGRLGLSVVVVVAAAAIVVVDASEPELEHPATTGRINATRAAEKGTFRERRIGSW